MKIPRNHDLAVFLLRITLGVVMIAHSLYLKLFIFTLSGTAEFFGSLGLPEVLAYVVFFLEAICGIALILGYKSQIAAVLLIPVLIGATWAHWDAGWLFINEGGGWEYPMVLVLMAVIQSLTSNGKYALEKEPFNEK